ncbi:MAG: diguanylate cyclase response regulator [Acidobacteriia bacterium]|nr:diguanylate cyclase response regulator [Terriglobia bacterium]
MSMNNGEPIRILLVGEAREARRLRELLESDGSEQFHIAHVPAMEVAAECLFRDDTDVLLLDIGPDQSQGRAIVRAASTTAPRVPTVILSESEDESLAVASLQQGVQDFLAKEHLDCAALGRSLRYAIERHRVQKTLQSLSLIDDLTGLHNRRGFRALAEQHLRLILRNGAALLVYVDLDELKTINDTYGHLEGNRALIATANVLRASFRQSDILARLGGDEFCVLMTDARQNTAQQVRKRLQRRVDFTNAHSHGCFRLSLSIGITQVPVVHQPPLEELIRHADALMYEEKRNKQARASNSFSVRHPAPA